MSREWKPGDVAMVETDCCGASAAVLYADEWRGGNGSHSVDGSGVTVKPLAVLDPADRAQAERFAAELRTGIESVLRVSVDDYSLDRIADKVQNALDMFAATPKPEEPTGLGAVVEDEKGDAWVRDRKDDVGYLGVLWLNVRTRSHRHYDRITAVRVLSEGVVQP